MIIKKKEPIRSADRRQIAGVKQEQDVMFFLRREFKDTENVFVFNDLRIKYNDEVAQIDHLILHCCGFILIESKSITGEVMVNSDEEWSRSYNAKWSGIPSPIQQVSLQQMLLRELLHENKAEILGKMLFGKVQQTFRKRSWEVLCAVSSNAIIHRDNMPETVSNKLVKSEFLVKRVKNIISKTYDPGFFSMDVYPRFTLKEMNSICDFLLTQHQPALSESPNNNPVLAPSISKHNNEPVPKAVNVNETKKLSCKSCDTSDSLHGAYGKFGYYVNCGSCGANTSMRQSCNKCSSKNTKVSKKQSIYTLTCLDCDEAYELYTQA